MRTLIIVQSNTGHGHISRANALGEHLEDKLVLSRPFSGKSKSKDFSTIFQKIRWRPKKCRKRLKKLSPDFF